MRLVFLTNIPSPYRTAFYNKLNQHCILRGIKLEVWYCAKKEPDRHWEFIPEENKYEYLFLRGVHINMFGMFLHFNPSVVRAVWSKPEFLIAGGSWNMPTNWLMLFSVDKSYVRLGFWSEGHRDAARYSRGLVSWIRRFFLAAFDYYVIPNKKSKVWISEQVDKRGGYYYLANTVEEELYVHKSDFDKRIARSELGINDNCIMILQVSQLESRKGVVELVDAYRSLNDHERINTILAIVGTGSLRKEMQALVDSWNVNGRVILVGQVSKEIVVKWMHASDWFVLNTFRDHNPLTVIEAAFAGMPLVVSRFAGNINELVKDCFSGYIIDEPQYPKDVLVKMLNTDEQNRLTMGQNAAVLADKYFKRDVVIDKFLDDLLRDDA